MHKIVFCGALIELRRCFKPGSFQIQVVDNRLNLIYKGWCKTCFVSQKKKTLNKAVIFQTDSKGVFIQVVRWLAWCKTHLLIQESVENVEYTHSVHYWIYQANCLQTAKTQTTFDSERLLLYWQRAGELSLNGKMKFIAFVKSVLRFKMLVLLRSVLNQRSISVCFHLLFHHTYPLLASLQMILPHLFRLLHENAALKNRPLAAALTICDPTRSAPQFGRLYYDKYSFFQQWWKHQVQSGCFETAAASWKTS